MQLVINGQAREVPDGLTVAQLLEHLDLGHERVAVECNGEIVERERFPTHALQPGDALEIVRFVGGG
ncbi:thiamine biosynthesis protein ThiS [Alicyclobacillus cellulosilyticus]|uniref:Thiamine biosynthesis protein ThiS n=1 Tax=Alicyclobacillus cellulosilyticus TaxID=1003997 RepID=A0A917K7A6_9BACL|nr:sulfur carrier protein ThiS [Alicyclobacillus cellulosilyticus]GGJ01688.1 thiamine biosynthesis protein ThiS [Alicyclobacillus cellulosilyticus]